MRCRDLAAVAAVIIVTGCIVFVDTAVAADTSRQPRAADGKARAAVTPVPAKSVRCHEAPPTALGADPDPGYFDRACVEIWWAHYRKAHPGR